MRLFHYTTEKRYYSILNSGRLDPSIDRSVDATYGEGWYFTDLRPGTCEKAIMVSCWQKTTMFQRIRYYLEFDIDDALIRKCRDHVYFVPIHAYISMPGKRFTLVSHGKNPECPLKPCYRCSFNELFENL